MTLIPIQYHIRRYPPHIRAEIAEVAGHFDVYEIKAECGLSLHTEYSYGRRRLDSHLLRQFPALIDAHHECVPRLWYSEQWAAEFAGFVKLLCGDKKLLIIEIHPPFDDYVETCDQFMDTYGVFEEIILERFPDVEILIENRYGSQYKGGRFLTSTSRDLQALCNLISSRRLRLRVALDTPQLLSAYGGIHKLAGKKVAEILTSLNSIQPMTQSMHLWGKSRSRSGKIVSHFGDLDSYCEDEEKKDILLNWLTRFLEDGRSRYFVPEVNSSDEDLRSIIFDLERVGIRFC